jgi:hypothetical protein
MNADNVSSNDTQTMELSKLNNSFDEENRARCFNHTLQLSGKALIQPFNPGMGKAKGSIDGEGDGRHDSISDTLPNTDLEGKDLAADEAEDVNENDDGIDEIEELPVDKQAALLRDTAVVRSTVTKVCGPCYQCHTQADSSSAPSVIFRNHTFSYLCACCLASPLRKG